MATGTYTATIQGELTNLYYSGVAGYPSDSIKQVPSDGTLSLEYTTQEWKNRVSIHLRFYSNEENPPAISSGNPTATLGKVTATNVYSNYDWKTSDNSNYKKMLSVAINLDDTGYAYTDTTNISANIKLNTIVFGETTNSYTITNENNLTGLTISNILESVSSSELPLEHTYKLVPSYDSYKITTIPHLKIIDDNSNVIVDNDFTNFSLTVTFPATINSNLKATFTGSIVETESYPITYNTTALNNLTLENTETSLNVGDSYTFKLKPSISSYTIETQPHLLLRNRYTDKTTGTSAYVKLLDNDLSLNNGVFEVTTNAITAHSNTANYIATFTGSLAEKSTTKQYNLTYDTSNLANLTLENTESVIDENTSITFKLKPSIDNYSILVTPVVQFFYLSNGAITGYSSVINLTKNNNEFEHTTSFSLSSTIDTIKIVFNGSLTEKSEILDLLPFNDVFSVDHNILNTLTSQRFISSDIDLQKYVVNLFKTYIPYNEGDEKEIVLGYHNTGITAKIVTNHYSTVKSNTIEIPYIDNNSNDYNGYFDLYLPFIGTKRIDKNLLINKKVCLEYITNNITGSTIVNVYANDVIVDKFVGNAYFKIPLNEDNYNNTKVVNSIDDTNKYFSLIPYINQYTPVLYGSIDTINKTDEYLLLSTLTGYCQGDCYKLSIDEPFITNDEKEQITSLISKGIIL